SAYLVEPVVDQGQGHQLALRQAAQANDGGVALAVGVADAQAGQGGGVGGGAVALVAGELVARVALVESQHPAVAVDLGDDGGGGDAEGAQLAAHERLLGQRHVAGQVDRVDQERFRLWVEHGHGALHGGAGGGGEAVQVHLGGTGAAYSNRDGRGLDEAEEP